LVKKLGISNKDASNLILSSQVKVNENVVNENIQIKPLDEIEILNQNNQFYDKKYYLILNKPVGIEIFKDPITDGGTKKSAKGLLQVYEEDGVIKLKDQCTWEEEGKGLLQVIFEDGKFYNQTSLTEIRARLDEINKA
jgi:ribosomal protein S4